MYRTLVLCAASFALVAPAFASDTYPGAECRQESGGTPTVDAYGRLSNTSSSSTLNVVCPVAADPTTTSSAAAIFVVDQHYSSNISCTARYFNSGGSWGASSTVSSSGSSATYQSLTPTEPAYAYTFTSRFFYCSVPATYSGNASTIQLYRH